MELKLQKQCIKVLEIDGQEFRVDLKDVEKIEKLEAWAVKQNTVSKFSAETMQDCPALIDAILGEGAFASLFKGYENSSAQYELCFELHRIFRDEFLKDQKAQNEAEERASLDKVDKLCDSMDRFNKAIEYTDKRYGGRNAVAGNGRPSKKYKR